MINTSELFSSKIAESTRQFRARLMYRGKEISGAIRSVQITSGACSEGNFAVGIVFSPYIEVVIDECKDAFEGRELLLQIGVVVDDETVEYIDIGYYTVTNSKTSAYSKDFTSTTFTAVGRITSKLNKYFDVPEAPTALTLRNIADAIRTKTGVTIKFKGNVANAVLTKDLRGMTCRDVLSIIVGTFGGFATEDNEGNIVVCKFDTDMITGEGEDGSDIKAEKVSIDGDRMTELPEFNDYDYELSSIKVIVSPASIDENGNTIEEVAFATEGTPRITVTNNFMTEDLFGSFAANTVGYTYRPGTVPLALGDPRLQPWDCLEVTDVKGNVHIVPCLNIVHTFDGGFATTITAPGESESESNFYAAGPITQYIQKIVGDFPTKLSAFENDAGYLTEVPDEYVKQEDLEELSEFAHGAVDEIVDAVIKHREDNVIHITAEERTAWNGKAEPEDIPTKYSELEDDIGVVKTINYIAPDENGNVNVEGGSGSGKADSAFKLLKSDTLTWNGDMEGKEVAVNTLDPTMSYVRVSSIIPTLAELQKGGIWATTGDDGVEYDMELTSDNIVDKGTLIEGRGGYFLVAKEDGVRYADENTDCTLPKAGIYFISFAGEGYMSKLTITDYTGFTKPILKMDSLTKHGHGWYGNIVKSGNTALRDDTQTGGYVKVSDSVPTEAELRKGGVIRFYDVEDGQIGDLITGNYLDSDFTFIANSDEITIWYGFSCLVVISKTGRSNGGVTYNGIDGPGVYFYQGNQYFTMHSLTINDYTGFSFNLEKVPTELLPEDYIKQVVSDSIKIPTKVSAFENDSGYLTSVPSEYVTETELKAKGYLTEVTEDNLPTDYIKQLITESLSADYIKQLIKEVIAEIVGTDTDGLQDLNGDYLYDVLQNKLITKEE